MLSRGPLRQVLEVVYRIPGLLGCLRAAVESGQVADASPIGWFLLTLASQVRSGAGERTAPRAGWHTTLAVCSQWHVTALTTASMAS